MAFCVAFDIITYMDNFGNKLRLFAKNKLHSISSFASRNKAIFILYIVAVLIAICCWLFVGHGDVITTALNSTSLLKGHIFDFYSFNYIKELDDTNCNYLITTYIIFAIWNIPTFFGYNQNITFPNAFFSLYNHFLPSVVYIVCAVLLFKICKKFLNFSEKKSHYASLLFLLSPFGFFSQFIFSQYDSFTILFMLIGIICLFKYKRNIKGLALFSIFFSIATSFKYFALLAYLIILFVMCKDFKKVLISIGIFAIPLILIIGPFLISDANYFIKSIFISFSSLRSSGGWIIDLGYTKIHIVWIFLIIIIAYAYFRKSKTDELSIIQNSTFLITLACACFFSFSHWNPQWIMFFALFMALTTINSKYMKELLLLNVVLSCIFIIFICSSYVHNVDEAMFRNNLLSPIFCTRIDNPYPMKSLFGNISDSNLGILFTFLASGFFIYSLAAHPRFLNNSKNDTNLVSIHFIYPGWATIILMFFIPAAICLIKWVQLT